MKKRIFYSRLVLPAIFSVISFCIIIVAGSFEYADIHAQRAYLLMDSWEKEKNVRSLKELKTAYRHLSIACKYNPFSADYITELGQLYEWIAYTLSLPVDKQKSMLRAKLQYKRAVAMRPTWPHAWANLAYSKMMCGEFDEEMEKAIRAALQYGPWDKGVQRKIAFVVFSSWDNVSDTTHDLLIASVKSHLLLGKSWHAKRYIFWLAAKENKIYVLHDVITNEKDLDILYRLREKAYRNYNFSSQDTYPVKRFRERFEV